MYSVRDYGAMINDKGRMEAYELALRNTVEPGAVVVDVGTGTGIAAMLACKLGAGHVYAIEANPAIQVARDIARANGYHEKITFFHDLSTNVNLPEKADLIVSDMRGVLPLSGIHIPSIIDARTRFLKPSGVLIPLQDTLMIGGVEAPDLYYNMVTPWSENSYDLDMKAGKQFIINSWGTERVGQEQMLLAPQTLATLDYTTISEPHINEDSRWAVENTGTLHGYRIWFDALLSEDVTFSTGPSSPELIYGVSFFPLTEPVEVVQGDTVNVRIEAKLVDDDYEWHWNTRVEREGNVVIHSKQNTLASIPLSLDQLRKRSNKYVPRLTEDGEITKFVMDLMSREIMLGDIASRLVKKYPRRFAKWDLALSYVGRIAQKYT